MEFRTLRADEIECRVQSVKKTGLILLLYKDARCDQNILDETVGPMNWQRHHSRDNANCTVSIWDESKGQWVEKEDTGTESNTEREKGLASDSFKRACFNWGIGRELYTAPLTWIDSADCNITKDGKCYDKFRVKAIGYDQNRRINRLEIYNDKTKRVVFRMGKEVQPTDYKEVDVSDREIKAFKDHCELLGVNYVDVMKQAGWKGGEGWNAELHGKALIILKEIENGR